LEVIRNKIAHCRRATTEEVGAVKSTYIKLVNEIGEPRFEDYLSRCTQTTDIPRSLRELQHEVEQGFEACSKCLPLRQLGAWSNISQQWWFDDTYLGHDLS